MENKFCELKGKKLLILSGVAMNIQTVQKAQEMGIHTIVADYYTDYSKSPAKKYADEVWNISWNDIDALEERCREEKVDGVLTGYSEDYVLSAVKLCERMGWPFYATEEQINITRNKVSFKPFCKRVGMPVLDIYDVSANPTKEELEQLQFPVVVKPSDNAGSRGISVCNNEQELRTGIRRALDFSPTDRFIVEPYVDAPELYMYYTIQDGNIVLSSSLDGIHGYHKKGTIKLTEGWVTPSKYLKEFVDTTDHKAKDVIKALGIKNGTFEFAMFYINGEFKVFECGFRLCGATNFNFSAAHNEINYMQMMIAHSLTGKMSGWDALKCENPFYTFKGCDFTPTAVPGVIGSMGSFDKIRHMDGLLSIDEFYHVGDEVPDSGAMNQNLARINIIADSAELLADKLMEIYDILDVKSIDGKSMLCSRIERDDIIFHWGGKTK